MEAKDNWRETNQRPATPTAVLTHLSAEQLHEGREADRKSLLTNGCKNHKYTMEAKCLPKNSGKEPVTQQLKKKKMELACSHIWKK